MDLNRDELDLIMRALRAYAESFPDPIAALIARVSDAQGTAPPAVRAARRNPAVP